MSEPIKVLIVDDSSLVRKVMSDLLTSDPDIEVVGTAIDGSFALQKIKSLQPDVVTLDVEMRQMGGLELLPKIMDECPVPVIMVSGFTQTGARETIRALELGAIDFVSKPTGDARNIQEIGNTLIAKIKACARSPLRRNWSRFQNTSTTIFQRKITRPAVRPHLGISQLLIAIGASTGGTEAIREVLINLPKEMPPIVIVQHMPEGFTAAFSERLNGQCELEVREGKHNDDLVPGLALIAPGHSHMTVQPGIRTPFRVTLDQGELVSRHRPSVNKLFDSVAEIARRRAIGVILTGMGADGAIGMRKMYENGAYNLAQDENSCVVYGMPKEAVKAGGTHEIVPLEKIPQRLVDIVYGRS